MGAGTTIRESDDENNNPDDENQKSDENRPDTDDDEIDRSDDDEIDRSVGDRSTVGGPATSISTVVNDALEQTVADDRESSTSIQTETPPSSTEDNNIMN